MASIYNVIVCAIFAVYISSTSTNGYPYDDLIQGLSMGSVASDSCCGDDTCPLLENVFSRIARSSNDSSGAEPEKNAQDDSDASKRRTKGEDAISSNSDAWNSLPDSVQSQLYGMYYAGVQTIPLSSSMVIDLTQPASGKTVAGGYGSMRVKSISVDPYGVSCANGSICNSNTTSAANGTADASDRMLNWKDLVESVMREQEQQLACMIEQQIEEERYRQYVHKQRELYLLDLQRQQQPNYSNGNGVVELSNSTVVVVGPEPVNSTEPVPNSIFAAKDTVKETEPTAADPDASDKDTVRIVDVAAAKNSIVEDGKSVHSEKSAAEKPVSGSANRIPE